MYSKQQPTVSTTLDEEQEPLRACQYSDALNTGILTALLWLQLQLLLLLQLLQLQLRPSLELCHPIIVNQLIDKSWGTSRFELQASLRRSTRITDNFKTLVLALKSCR
jgi:hypothetical protein